MTNMTAYQNLTLVRQDEHIEIAELDGEWMLMNIETHAITKLNELGGLIWSILPECPTIDKLVDRIVNEYGVPQEVVLPDVELFVGEMLSVGLFAIE